jgi:hypothetical protein
MSTYEHDLLTARFAALAPRPLPGDWDDVLDRAGALNPGRGRLARSLWRGSRRRKLVVALAVAVLVAAVAAAAYGTVRVLFLDRGFIGLPPIGATPSAPEGGELVLQWEGNSATHARPHWRGGLLAPLVRAWVYADGRMIWSWTKMAGRIPEGANELTSGYLEQRLTPEGVELLRSEVAGLLDRSRPLLETVPADDDPRNGPGPFGGLALFVPQDYGSDWGEVHIRDGDGLVRLQWRGGPGGFADGPGGFEGTIATPEQLSALRRVDALLTDPASVLPSSAWAVRKVRAYVPSHYQVCIDTSPPKDASQLLALLPAQAADVLRDKSWTSSEGDVFDAARNVMLGRSVTYCSKLTTEEAREVAEPLSGFDPARHQSERLAYQLAEAVNNLNPTTIWFEPYFPHGQVTCSACG